jgi:predicted nucleic acid-binding protein
VVSDSVFLLDTNVLSHVAPARRKSKDDDVAEWIVSRSDDLWLSVVTAAEMEDGIAKAARMGATKKAEHLAEWWGEIRHYYADRILSLNLEIAQETGRLMDRARAAGISPGFEDVAIAATGKVRGLIVLTRNIKDFDPLGVACRNPFDALPD